MFSAFNAFLFSVTNPRAYFKKTLEKCLVHGIVTIFTFEHVIRGLAVFSNSAGSIFSAHLYTFPIWLVTNNLFVFSLIWSYSQLDDENLHIALVHYFARYGLYWVGFALYVCVDAFKCAGEYSDTGLSLEQVWEACENPLVPTFNFISSLLCGLIVQCFWPPLMVLPWSAKHGNLNYTVSDILKFEGLSFREKCDTIFATLVLCASITNYAWIDEDGQPLTPVLRIFAQGYTAIVASFLIYCTWGGIINIFQELKKRQRNTYATKDEDRKKQQTRLQRTAENFSTLDITKVANRVEIVGKKSSEADFL